MPVLLNVINNSLFIIISCLLHTIHGKQAPHKWPAKPQPIKQPLCPNNRYRILFQRLITFKAHHDVMLHRVLTSRNLCTSKVSRYSRTGRRWSRIPRRVEKSPEMSQIGIRWFPRSFIWRSQICPDSESFYFRGCTPAGRYCGEYLHPRTLNKL